MVYNDATAVNKLSKLMNKQESYDFYKWMYKFLSGSIIGLSNATLVTPLVNYSNHVIERRGNRGKNTVKFTCARAFDGVLSYNLSFILRVGVSLPLNGYFLHKLNGYVGVDKTHQVMTSILAGGVAGAFAALPEAIAQTQQLSLPKPSSLQVIREAYRCNGLFSLTRGTSAMVGRSAGFTAGYLGFMPMMCESMRQKMGDHFLADVFSAIVCGLAVGAITTPFNTLRFKKQEHFTQKSTAPSYSALLRSATFAGLYVGFLPRTVMYMFSMWYIAEGNKLCHAFSKDGFPEFPSLKPR